MLDQHNNTLSMFLYESKLARRRCILMLIENAGAELNDFVCEHYFIEFVLLQVFYHSSHKQEHFLT
jgi:hypothetical protein